MSELFAAPQHPHTLGLLGAVPRPGDDRARLAEIPGQVPPYEPVRLAHPVARFHPGAREAVPA